MHLNKCLMFFKKILVQAPWLRSLLPLSRETPYFQSLRFIFNQMKREFYQSLYLTLGKIGNKHISQISNCSFKEKTFVSNKCQGWIPKLAICFPLSAVSLCACVCVINSCGCMLGVMNQSCCLRGQFLLMDFGNTRGGVQYSIPLKKTAICYVHALIHRVHALRTDHKIVMFFQSHLDLKRVAYK